MTKLIEEYLRYLDTMEGKSLGTIKQYKKDVSMFFMYMKNNAFDIKRDTVKRVKLADIYGFLGSVANKNSNSARRNKISALRSFFEYCRSIELINHNIMYDIKKQPKLPTRIVKYFTTEECKKLINSVSGRNAIRDKAIIILAVNTGLRLSELVSLNVDCINNNTRTVIGKGNKERPIYINSEMREILKEYVESRPETKEKALFLSERGNRINPQTVEHAIKNAIQKAGLNIEGKRGISAHILRHSFATNKYKNGSDIRKIQVLLGHKDLSTTQIYTHISDEQLQQDAEDSIVIK